MSRPHVAFGYDDAMRRQEHLRQAEAMAAAEASAGPVPPHVQEGYERSLRMDERNQRRQALVQGTPDYQRKGQAGLRGYASNPLEEAGRNRITNQFWEAPLGGHVRSAAEGLGLEADHARMAEQGLAGLTAVGIGVPAFMAAVQQLSTPPDQNTIPL
jgi:hypothetical protein